MSDYLVWNKKNIIDFSDKNINRMYNDGYVFTRKGKGVMNQTRSLRVDLSKFELSSENKRILKKISDFRFLIADLPMADYHWSIGKLAKDFYETKFGAGTFSANKIKELLTTDHNFNKLFRYRLTQNVPSPLQGEGQGEVIGYCIALETNEIIHYSYPFYNLIPNTYNLIPNLGMSMMLQAIIYGKESGKKYIYLGSAQRPTDTYKLQFKGLEWFDGEKWNEDLGELKNVLK